MITLNWVLDHGLMKVMELVEVLHLVYTKLQSTSATINSHTFLATPVMMVELHLKLEEILLELLLQMVDYMVQTQVHLMELCICLLE